MLIFGLTLTPLSTTGIQIVRIKALWFFQVVQYSSNIHDLSQKIKCYYKNLKHNFGVILFLSSLYFSMFEKKKLC